MISLRDHQRLSSPRISDPTFLQHEHKFRIYLLHEGTLDIYEFVPIPVCRCQVTSLPCLIIVPYADTVSRGIPRERNRVI